MPTLERGAWISTPDEGARAADLPSASRAESSEPGRAVAAADGYRILAEIGCGGMGVVYKAQQVGLNRLVALKMVRESQASTDGLHRFRTEAEVVAQMRHANIVQIFEIGERDGLPFVAFELLEGGTLADRLATRPLTGREAGDLMVTLARAMHAAHRAGVVHRDLKPPNILFTHDGVPKIADFGLAKRFEADDGQTRTGQIMGTPSYMAPEQARGDIRQIGPPADVYALGAILYEMLTGRPPFKGPTVIETIRQVTDVDPLSPSKLQPNVPRDLETICLKCLEKDPKKRYPSAAALADDLVRYLSGEPVRARRTPPWERAVKWVRRHPTAATLLTLGLIAVVVSAGVWRRYEEGVRRAERTRESQLATLRGTVQVELAKAQVALDQQRWGDAKVILGTELNRVGGEPRLRELRGSVADLLKTAEAGLARNDAKDRAIAALEKHSKRYAEFLDLRDKALYHVTGLTGLTSAENNRVIREQASRALALFAPVPGGAAARPLTDLPEGLKPETIDEIRERNYELLVVLAGVTETPAEGLAALDRAARLGSTPTRAFHLGRASCLERMGDKEGAASERAAAAAVQPSSAFDQFLTGLDLYKAGDFPGAARRFDAAFRLQPGYFWAQCLSALCDLQQGRPSEAKVGLSACLTLRPDLAVLHVLRGLASCTLAEREPKTAKSAVANLLADADADFEKAEALLNAQPDEVLRYALLVNRGTMWYLRERWDDAAADLAEAIRSYPERTQAHATLAQVYQKKGEPVRALETYTSALNVRPRDPALFRARAQIVVDLKAAATPAQRRSAIADLNQAIGFEPPRSPVLAIDRTNLARLLDRDGRHEEALAACDAALEIAPKDAARQRLETRLVKLAILSRLSRYDDVIRSCDDALATGLPSSKLLELRGLARSFLKDYPGAINDLTQAIPIAPPADRPILLSRLGELHLLTDANRLAAHDFEEALRLNPSIPEAHAGRGLALARQGDYDAAAIEAEETLRLGDPRTPVAPYLAARVYMQAAASAQAPPRRAGALPKSDRFQDRARVLLNLALHRLSPEDRDDFVREKVLPDPLLRRLGRTASPP